MSSGVSLRVASSALLLLTLAAGCGGSSAAPAADPVPIDQFAARFAEAWCTNVGPCCMAAAWSFELASCKRAAEQGYGASLVAPAINVPSTVRYDAHAAGACLQAVASLAHSCDATGGHSVDVSCRALLVGTQPPGAACTVTAECAASDSGKVHCTGASTEAGSSGSPGVCEVEQAVVVTHGKQGGQCLGTCTLGGPCITSASNEPSALPCFTSDNLYCQMPRLTCQPLGQVGQGCSAGACVAGAFCDSGTCAAQRESGPCQVGGDTCSATSFCNSGSGNCEPKRANGSPCQEGSWCQMNQCVYPEPNGSGVSAPGTCSSNSLANGKACSGGLG